MTSQVNIETMFIAHDIFIGPLESCSALSSWTGCSKKKSRANCEDFKRTSPTKDPNW